MTTRDDKVLLLARERGFCGGVRSALAMLNRLLAEDPNEPVYILHELVHNNHVTDELRKRGVRFVDDLSEVPKGARLLFGAHGVPPETTEKAKLITDRIHDASCPLVQSRQRAAAELEKADTLVLLGHPGHAEVVGILGWSSAGENFVIPDAAAAEKLPEIKRPVLLSQTTFDADKLNKCRDILERRFPKLVCRGGLCRASLERQQSVNELAEQVETLVVVGSEHSSNARRLCETAERRGVPAVLTENAAHLPPHVLKLRRVGLTAGASTPDTDFDEIAALFAASGFATIDLKDKTTTGERDHD